MAITNVSQLDTRKLATGKDGKVFVEVDGKQYFFAELENFTVSMSVSNTDTQPIGSIVVQAVPTGVTYSLQVSELCVRDDLIMKPLVEAIRAGKIPAYTFQGGFERYDGQEQRLTFRNCTPDGEFTLLNITPGEIIKRAMNFRINSVPEWISSLTYGN